MSTTLIILALALAATQAEGRGPPVAVEVEVSPATVRVGDPVELVLCVRATGAAAIRIEPLPPEAGELLLEELGSQEGIDLLGARVLRRRYRVIPFAVGQRALPAATVSVVAADGSAIETTTPALELRVLSIAPGEGGPEAIAGLKPPLSRPGEGRGGALWPWLVLAGLVLAVAAATALLLLRRTPRSLKELMLLTPAERALRELEELANSRLLLWGQVKQYYSALADSVRRYLALRFRITALEMTSSELLESLARLDGGAGAAPVVPQLQPLLETCDLVKFARLEPPSERGAEGIATAREIITLTRDDAEKQSASGNNLER